MDNLNAALKNYREAFSAKLDTYQSNIPFLDRKVSILSKGKQAITEPTGKVRSEKENDKSPTTADKNKRQPPKIKPESSKSGEKTKTGTKSKEERTIETKEETPKTPTEDNNPPIFEPQIDDIITKPTFEDNEQTSLPIIQRHIIHRIVTSISFRVSIGLLLLLFL